MLSRVKITYVGPYCIRASYGLTHMVLVYAELIAVCTDVAYIIHMRVHVCPYNGIFNGVPLMGDV